MLGWFQALMPKEERFFDLFESHAETLVQGARIAQVAGGRGGRRGAGGRDQTL
jgi:uncharacterized protein